ncbi:hypothetical protein M2404_002654 [Rheinheimera pacifica]|uniref:hypothetical protein n=1 Tax=Rheinheimera pacifica TaxID=173990 RepID=UPI00216A74B6|nr:hypothetical protein [Rheinheimera pacifica]MCS4308299.1 hypothetical protein [Rheinheimera pacifica]
MIAIIPLLGVLSMPVATSGFSGSERRTLQSAISSALYLEEINRFYQQCRQADADLAAVIANPDNERLKLQQLLQQKVSSTDIQYLLDADPKLTADLEQNIAKLKDCADVAAFQALQDSYDLALFSLEIATPLSKPLRDKSSVSASQAKQAQQQIQALIESSHAIAWVNVADRQQLSAVQQANYLHPDYQGRYVFKVQHGWRGNIGHYLGMHISVSNADIEKTTRQWLIFLDKNGRFINALEEEQASAHLEALQSADWRYDVHGNLQRNQ